jgi:hypothetical protein
LLKRGFFRHVREQKAQRKNPGNALRMAKSHLQHKAKDYNKLVVKNGTKVEKYTG